MINNDGITKQIQLNDDQRKLVEDYTPLGMKIAHEYYNTNMGMIRRRKLTRQDIFQVASEEMCKLALTYNAEKSKFCTFLDYFLRLGIHSTVQGFNIVKLPRLYDWDRHHKDNIIDLKQVFYYGVGELDKLVETDCDGEDVTLLNTIIDVHGSEENEATELMSVIKDNLSTRQYKALTLNLKGKTNSQIGDIMGYKPNSVKATLYQARIKVKEALAM